MARRIKLEIMALLVVAAVVLVAAGCGGTTTTTAGATTTTADATATTGDVAVADGAAVFATVCAGCHGADGTGNTGPDLTVRSSLTKERIVDQVTNGGSSMPEYGSKISADEISAVADYVLSDIVK